MTNKNSRRDFLKKSALLGGAAVAGLTTPRVHAAEAGPLKIGLLGCGGRGCGAAVDALTYDPDVKLVAVSDIFPEKADGAVKMLKERFKDRIAVTPETTFVGFDAYKSVIPLCDVVLNCTPQHFRPMTMKATIEGGKHALCEKPVAVDATGIRSIMQTAALAKEKGLNIVTGLTNRYSPRVRECVKRIHDGQIGDLTTARADRMQVLWMRQRVPGESEMRFQMKNWVNFNWMASEFINDVTIHQLDVSLWCMGDDLTPVSAYGFGGRTSRTLPEAGDLYDTTSIVYEYEDGRPLYAFNRTIPGCYSIQWATINGTKGKAVLSNGGRGVMNIYGENAAEIPKVASPLPREVQHTSLYRAVRSGGKEYLNHLPYTAKATMTAILGRMAVYSGQKITWEDAYNSTEDLRLDNYSWDTTPPILPKADGTYPIAMPGRKS